jgi:hypothetical protein
MEQRFQFRYCLTTVEDPLTGKAVPVSHGSPNNDQNYWITVPWNKTDIDPLDPLQPAIPVWTFLNGPCDWDVTCHIRMKNVEPGCSVHARLYTVTVASGVETRTWGSEAPEKQVLPFENPDSNTHIDFNWKGHLAVGERLRIEVDYWNATDPALTTGHIVGARIDGIYWRNV